jgi:thiamine-phosphate pyrophosphorylase
VIHAYAITDPKYYGRSPQELKASLRNFYHTATPDFLCYRDKSTADYEAMARSFILTCKELGIEATLLHSDVLLSHKLGAYGVHLTSEQFDRITQAKAYGLFCVISTHSEEEIQRAIQLGADAVTYSPIFATPNKGNPKGLEDLKEKVAKIKTKIIALGGIISDEDVTKIKTTGAYAFASIRYFVK